MHETRQTAPASLDLPVGPPQGGGLLPHGFQLDTHVHAEGLLVYAVSGIATMVTQQGTWIAPASRITWTPPGFEHAYRFYGETEVRVLSLPLGDSAALPARPGVFVVTPLLREALLALIDRATTRPDARERLRAVVIDELVEAVDRSIHLPEPRDDRLLAVTEALRADPARPVTLTELGRAAGASERTLSRLFHHELGMGFRQWRTLLRIHHALLHLGDGMSVTDTAITCGWANPTSFIDAFYAVVGQTPGRYQAELRATTRTS
ncbi:MAG TPA: helix-turn-helix transcriptional regulator [Cellulomonas sp.]